VSAEGELISYVARTSALSEGRFGKIGTPEGGEQRHEMIGTGAVMKKTYGLRAIVLLYGQHLLGDVIQRLIPGGLLILSLAPAAGADKRGLDPVGVIQKTHPGIPPGAKLSPTVGVERVAIKFYDLSVHDLGNSAAPPKTHLTVGGNAHLVWLGIFGRGQGGWKQPVSASDAGSKARDLHKLSSRNFHGSLSHLRNFRGSLMFKSVESSWI
jgi:hypothetical protein